MASDEHGVVFLASQPDWRYRLLSPLSPADEADLAATRQYIDQELHPMRYRVRQGLEQGSRLVQMQEPALPGTTLWQTLPLPDRTSTRLNSSHQIISYAVFCLQTQ